MANKLIFSVGIDLEAGVKLAEKNADKYLQRIEKALKSRPLKLDVALNAGKGSIYAIQKEMSSLVTEFNRLSEAQRIFNRTSGEYTPEAQKLIAKYAELTAATQTYAQSLKQITTAARKQTDEQLKEQQRELKAYEAYWKRKEAENAKQAQADIAAGDRKRKAQQQRIAQEQAADAKRYQEWLRQKNQEAIEAERVERQKQQSRERTIAQQTRELAEERRLQQQRQEAISASLRAEYQRIEAKRQAEAASRRELQMLNQQYAAEERRQRLASQEARIKGLQKLRGVLQAEENTIANINAKLQVHQQRLQQAEIGSRAWRKSAEEVKRLTAELDKANNRMRQLTGQTTAGAAKQTAAIHQSNSALSTQSTYLSRLIQRMTAYWSIQQVGTFLSKIREVTMQFELQRISLGAIIQDQNRADAMFRQIQGMALESPFKILDLTKYTKQLAAYQIETDDLLDTMKRLADVSAGVGVSMDRLILAYGQVKATGYLRASEVRQFTEAGIPLVAKLAQKLTAANGELVKASDVMDMISKRQIPFEMVAEVFEDMTKKGGIFYDMQKKQSETLYGLWQRLGDAASLMYNDIGTTPAVMEGMKSMIQLLRHLMLNWKAVAAAMVPVAAGIGLMVLRMRSMRRITMIGTAQNQAYVASLRAKVVALNQELVAQTRLTWVQRMSIKTQIAHTSAQIAAATSTNVLTAAMYRLKAAMLSNPWTLIATAILTIVTYFAMAKDEAESLSETLEEIEDKYARINRESGRNLVKLAETAVNAADGTKKQKDALDELSRTYGNIIPQELLTIDNLRKMQGEYEGLVALVDEYNAKQKYDERKSAIDQSYKTQLSEAEDNLRDFLNARGVSNSDPRQSEIVQNIKDKVNEGLSYIEATEQALKGIEDYVEANQWNIFYPEKMADAWEAGLDALAEDIGFGDGTKEAYEFAKAIEAYNKALADNDAAMEKEIADLNKYSDYVDRVTKIIKSTTENGMVLWGLNNFDIDQEALEAKISQLTSGAASSIVLDEEGYNKALKQRETALERIAELQAKITELENYKKSYPLNISQQRSLAFAKTELEELQNIDDTIASYEYTLEELSQYDWSNLAPSEQMVNLTNQRMQAIRDIIAEMLEESGYSIDEWSDTANGRVNIFWDGLIKDVTEYRNNPQMVAALESMKTLWEEIAPSDYVTQLAHKKVMGIADSTGMSTEIIKKCLKKSGEDWDEYAKRVKESVEDIILAKIAALRGEIRDLEDELAGVPEDNWVMPSAVELRKRREELSQYEKDLEGVRETQKWIDTHLPDEGKSGRGGRNTPKKHDNRLQNLQEIERTLTSINKKYDELVKKEGKNAALDYVKKNYEDTLIYVNGLAKRFGLKFSMPTEFTDLQTYRESILRVIKQLKAEGTMKAALELELKLAEADQDKLEKDIEAELKRLADRISRTKTAKEFYGRILSQTGDYDLAAKLSFTVYGEEGKALKQQVIDQIQATLGKTTDGVDIDFSSAINADKSINYDELARIADAQLKLGNISEDTYNKILKMRDEDRKDLAKTVEGWLKATEKAKSYSDKYIDLTRKTNLAIAEIEEKRRKGDITNEFANEQAQLFREKEAKEAANLEYEAFKDTPLYTQMFEDLDFASTSALERMRDRLIKLQGEWKDLDPTQIKELQSRIEDIDEQLAKRNPFKTLSKAWKDWRKLRKSGRTKGGDEKAADEAETARQAAWDKMVADEAAYQAAIKASGAESEAAKAARAKADASKEAYDAAEKTANSTVNLANEWKTLTERIDNANSVLDEYQAQVNKALDGIFDMMDALGVDAADMEFFRTIADSLNQIFDGAQLAGKAFADFSSGNIFSGVISSVGAITSIVSGISNIFYASKVRKANKEIEKQEEILEGLEYSYGRLEKAADKLFGTDYIENYNKRMEVLLAQQAAYQKQADAERSKGKKADKEKIKEYENQARDTADEIADMENDLISKMSGTDRTSLAREFAESWLDAKVSFESTTDAIASKYKEMIKSMIVEGAAARIIDSILAPMWEKANTMLENEDIDGAIDYIIGNIDNVVDTADRAMNTFYERMEAKGYDMDRLLGESDKTGSSATGIKRDYATASEESINGLAAAVNTQNWYISHVPTIASEVRAMRTFMEQSLPQSITGVYDIVQMQTQAMTNLQSIDRHTAETVAECQRIATACEAQVNALNKVIIGKNSAGAYSIQVSMR